MVKEIGTGRHPHFGDEYPLYELEENDVVQGYWTPLHNFSIDFYRVKRKLHQGSQSQVYIVEPMDPPFFKDELRIERKLPDELVLKLFQRLGEEQSTRVASLDELDDLSSEVDNEWAVCAYLDSKACKSELYVMGDLSLVYPKHFITPFHQIQDIYDAEDIPKAGYTLDEERHIPSKSLDGIIIQKVEGVSLEENIRKKQDFDKEAIAQKLIKQVFAMYTLQLIHRDISLSNIMVEGSKPYIIDFSMAALTSYAKYKNGNLHELIKSELEWCNDDSRPFVDATIGFLGNRLFSPLEVYKGRLHKYHDNWSLGCVLYAIFTGKHPVPLNFEEELSFTRKVQKKTKREFSDFMEYIAKHKSRMKKLQRVVTERVHEADIPLKYKPAIAALLTVDCDERPYLMRVMEMLNLKPYKPSLKKHNFRTKGVNLFFNRKKG